LAPLDDQIQPQVNSIALLASPLTTKNDKSSSPILITARAHLKHLKSFGSRGSQLSQFKFPAGLCLQPFTRRLLVCDDWNHRVQVFSLDGGDDDEAKYQPLYAIGRGDGQPSEAKGAFNRPFGLCCAGDGSMAVAEIDNHRVQLWDASGRSSLHSAAKEMDRKN
jgi:hypothetical protein